MNWWRLVVLWLQAAAALWNSLTHRLPACNWAMTSPRQVSLLPEPSPAAEFPCPPPLLTPTSPTSTADKELPNKACACYCHFLLIALSKSAHRTRGPSASGTEDGILVSRRQIMESSQSVGQSILYHFKQWRKRASSSPPYWYILLITSFYLSLVKYTGHSCALESKLLQWRASVLLGIQCDLCTEQCCWEEQIHMCTEHADAERCIIQ